MKTTIVINPAFAANAALVSFINNIDDEMQRGTTIFSGRNVVKRFEIDGFDRPIIVKRFRKPTFVNTLVYGHLRKTKARRAYLNAFEIIKRGFSTPTPFAFIEQTHCGLMGFCYYISGECNDAPIGSKIHPSAFDSTFAQAFARYVVSLHSAGILHYDLNSTNVLYNNENEEFNFSLIDINRMKFCPLGLHPQRGEVLENLTLFTGDLYVFSFVASKYIEIDKSAQFTLAEAVAWKQKHDRHYSRRKSFSHFFKKLF